MLQLAQNFTSDLVVWCDAVESGLDASQAVSPPMSWGRDNPLTSKGRTLLTSVSGPIHRMYCQDSRSCFNFYSKDNW